MNRTLRRRHRRLWIVVAMILLAGGWYAVRPWNWTVDRVAPPVAPVAVPNTDGVP